MTNYLFSASLITLTALVLMGLVLSRRQTRQFTKRTVLIAAIAMFGLIIAACSGTVGNAKKGSSSSVSYRVKYKHVKVGSERLAEAISVSESLAERSSRLDSELEDAESASSSVAESISESASSASARAESESARAASSSRAAASSKKAVAARAASTRRKTTTRRQATTNRHAPVNNGDMNTGNSRKIVGNINSKIYHVPGQAGYRMSSKNARYFNTEKQAIAAGYRKSKR